MRIFAFSGLHTDFAENRHRLQQISSICYLHDVVVVAGDIADDLKIIAWTLRLLRSKFNEPNIRAYNGPVITLSHFLPRRELLPPVSKLGFKGLPLVADTQALDRQIRALNSVIHVFGHSHINFDQVIDGVRYIQNAFGYPREDGASSFCLKLIWGADKQKEGPCRRDARTSFGLSIRRNPHRLNRPRSSTFLIAFVPVAAERVSHQIPIYNHHRNKRFQQILRF